VGIAASIGRCTLLALVRLRMDGGRSRQFMAKQADHRKTKRAALRLMKAYIAREIFKQFVNLILVPALPLLDNHITGSACRRSPTNSLMPEAQLQLFPRLVPDTGSIPSNARTPAVQELRMEACARAAKSAVDGIRTSAATCSSAEPKGPMLRITPALPQALI
jgi:hypothetical protein